MWSPRKARLASPIKRRSQNTQLPANCCGRKAQLDGKFSALCGFGIKPGYRSCQRDLGVLGNHPAVQNMLLAPRALGLGATLYLQFEKEAEAALGLPPGVHSLMLCCRSATQWAGSDQSAVFRWPMPSTRTDGASLSGICSDLVAFTRRCLSRRTDRLASVILNVRGRS